MAENRRLYYLRKSAVTSEKRRKNVNAMKSLLTNISLFFLLTTTAHAARIHPESYYRDIWCTQNNGEAEVKLEGRTRADCVTDTHAIEVEFANKWKDGIGQAFWYAIQTGKKAGILMILERPNENKYWIRLNTVIQTYELPIDTWRVEGTIK